MTTRIHWQKMAAKCLGVLCLLPLLSLAGCASSYNCYPCGRVSCNYCPPKPLPSADYENCNCKDSIGQAYLSNMSSQNYAISDPFDATILEGIQPDFEPQAEETNGIPNGKNQEEIKYP